MPNWKKVVNVADLFRDGDPDEFEQRRDRIVERLKNVRYYDIEDEYTEIVDELAVALDVEEFDSWWDALYDWGDVGRRLWIETVSTGIAAR